MILHEVNENTDNYLTLMMLYDLVLPFKDKGYFCANKHECKIIFYDNSILGEVDYNNMRYIGHKLTILRKKGKKFGVSTTQLKTLIKPIYNNIMGLYYDNTIMFICKYHDKVVDQEFYDLYDILGNTIDFRQSYVLVNCIPNDEDNHIKYGSTLDKHGMSKIVFIDNFEKYEILTDLY